jgi:MYXO-CTERM domain-containing protein
MSRKGQRLAVLSLVVGAALLPERGFASTGYPAEIQSKLSLQTAPPCTYCHAGDPDAGVAGTPLALDMKKFGLVGGNNLPSLDGALAGMQGTGDPFYTDLQDGVDPNASANSTIPPITYGCTSTAGQGSRAGLALLLVLGVAIFFLHRPRMTGR